MNSKLFGKFRSFHDDDDDEAEDEDEGDDSVICLG